MSLPFISLGMSISSYKPSELLHPHNLELYSCVLFLLSGFSGLLSKKTFLKFLLLNIKATRTNKTLNSAPEKEREYVCKNNNPIFLAEKSDFQLHISGLLDFCLLSLFLLGFIFLMLSRYEIYF